MLPNKDKPQYVVSVTLILSEDCKLHVALSFLIAMIVVNGKDRAVLAERTWTSLLQKLAPPLIGIPINSIALKPFVLLPYSSSLNPLERILEAP